MDSPVCSARKTSVMLIKVGTSVAAVSSKADTQMALTASSPAGILRGSLLATFFKGLKVGLKCYTNLALPLSRGIWPGWCATHWTDAMYLVPPLSGGKLSSPPCPPWSCPLSLRSFQAVLTSCFTCCSRCLNVQSSNSSKQEPLTFFFLFICWYSPPRYI